MRFILVSVGAILLVGILILTARIWGLGQTFPVYEHEFFKSGQPLVVLRANTLPSAKAAIAAKPDVVIWVDVRMSKDKVPFILAPSRDQEFLNHLRALQEKNPATPIMTGGKLSEYSWEQINEFYKDTPALKEYYEQFPQTRFVLNVIDNVSEVHSSVISAIENLNPNARTLIQSDTLVIMTSIKEFKPEWLYGTSLADIMRLLSFDSLYILPSTQFKGDVFIAPFKVKKRPALNENVIEEMRRRHKHILLGPLENSEDFTQAKAYKTDGYIGDNLDQLIDWIGQ